MEHPTGDFESDKNRAIAEVERRTGPSNFFRAMSQRPVAMREFARLYETVMSDGSVSPRIKELVYLAVSAVNECDYCSTHHEESARKQGITSDEIADLRAETDTSFSDKERTALRFARELTRTVDAERQTRDAMEYHFEAEQVVELTLVIGLANFSNRFNNGLRVPLEKEKHRTA